MELNEKACGSWLIEKEKRVKNNDFGVKIVDEKLEKKLEKMKSDIYNDTEKIIKKLNELYSLKPEKQTYDRLITLESIQKN